MYMRDCGGKTRSANDCALLISNCLPGLFVGPEVDTEEAFVDIYIGIMEYQDKSRHVHKNL